MGILSWIASLLLGKLRLPQSLMKNISLINFTFLGESVNNTVCKKARKMILVMMLTMKAVMKMAMMMMVMIMMMIIKICR